MGRQLLRYSESGWAVQRSAGANPSLVPYDHPAPPARSWPLEALAKIDAVIPGDAGSAAVMEVSRQSGSLLT